MGSVTLISGLGFEDWGFSFRIWGLSFGLEGFTELRDFEYRLLDAPVNRRS